MAEHQAYSDATQHKAQSLRNDGPPVISQDDMAKFNSLPKCGGGSDVVPNMEMYDSTNKCGPSRGLERINQTEQPAKQLDPDNPQAVGRYLDRAFKTNDPGEIKDASKNLSEMVRKHFAGTQLTADTLDDFEKLINDNIKTKGKGVDFEIKDGKIVTHISESVSAEQLVRKMQDGSVDPKMVRLDPKYGTLIDLTASTATEVPKLGSVVNERPDLKVASADESHVLQPNDDKLIRNLADRQSADHNLTPKAKQELEQALKLVAGSDSEDNVDKLAEMTGELYTKDGGRLREAFKDSLEELGYRVETESRLPENVKDAFAAKDFFISIREPNPAKIGGRQISLHYQFSGGLDGQEASTGSKQHLRSLR